MFHIIQRRPGTRDGGALHRLESLKIYRNRFDLEDRRGATFIRTGPSNGIARRSRTETRAQHEQRYHRT